MPSLLDNVSTNTVSDDSSVYIYRYHSPNRPPLVFHCTKEEYPDWQSKLYLGVELEFDSTNRPTYRRDNKLATISDVNDAFGGNAYVHFETDGSIRKGLEFITQPSTYNFYLQYRDRFEQAFEYIKQHGFGADLYASTGFHVHFNRDYIDASTLEKFLYMVERYWPELIYFSRRRYPDVERWADKYHFNTPQNIVKNMQQGRLPMMWNGRPDRYHAVNVCNATTIEVRLFHGTLDSQTFYATLNLVYNMVEAAKKYTEEEIKRMPFEFLLSTQEAQEYYHKCCAPQKLRKYQNYAGQMARNDFIANG